MTPIDVGDLDHPPVVHLDDRIADAAIARCAAPARPVGRRARRPRRPARLGVAATETGDGTVADRARRMEAWVPVGSSLKAAFSEMLQHDAGWVAVLDGDRYLGVLTPTTLHEALRRSVESDLQGVDAGQRGPGDRRRRRDGRRHRSVEGGPAGRRRLRRRAGRAASPGWRRW